MNELNIETLIAKYLAKEISETEEKTLMEWVERDPANQISFDEMKMIWGDSIPETIDFSSDQNEIWENIDILIETETVEPEVNQPIVKKLPFYSLRNIAAAIALLVGIGLWWTNSTHPAIIDVVAFETGKDATKNIVLPDGSKITLNANSKLTYQSDFKIRDVILEGEAFFEIARDTLHPFSIHSNGALTQVLGTSFNIRAYSNESEVEVTVVTGKVAFSKEKMAQTDKVILLPGNKAILKKEENKVVKTLPTPNEMAWNTKKLIFDDTNMGDILKTLKRFYHLDIDLDNNAIKKCHFTGHFQNASIDEVLKALSFALNLESEKTSQKLIFKGKGCD